MTSSPQSSKSDIDAEGYRANVGMVICNDEGKLFWGRRAGQTGWQFPQGGIDTDEDPIEAMYRELNEEVGLSEDQVQLLGHTDDWLKYQLPDRYRRRDSKVECIGQKQLWYLLRLNGPDAAIDFSVHDHPEFEEWRWVDYWYPVNHVIYFKRTVYKRALRQLQDYLPQRMQ